MLHVLDMSYSVIAPEDVVTALGEESCSWGYPKDSAVSIEMIPLEHGLSFQV